MVGTPPPGGRPLAYVALLSAAVIWGLAFPVMKAAVSWLGPLDVAVGRILLGAVGSVGLVGLARGRPGDVARVVRRHAPILVVLSLLVGYGQSFSLTYGIARTPAAIAALIPPLNPICTMLLAAWGLGERVTPRQWGGVWLAAAGVILLGFRHGWPTWSELSGPLILALTPLSWAFYTVLSKPLLRDIAPLQLTALTLMGGLIVVSPWVSVDTVRRLLGATPVEWAAIAYLGLLTMTVGYALWYFGLSRIGAAATGATALGIPLVGVVGSWLFLGESLGTMVLVAAGLMLGGLHLVLGSRG